MTSAGRPILISDCGAPGLSIRYTPAGEAGLRRRRRKGRAIRSPFPLADLPFKKREISAIVVSPTTMSVALAGV